MHMALALGSREQEILAQHKPVKSGDWASFAGSLDVSSKP